MLSPEEHAQFPNDEPSPAPITGPLSLAIIEEQDLQRDRCSYPQLPNLEAVVEIRPLQAREEWSLKEMLYEALFIPAGQEPFPKSIVELPELNKYIAEFGGQGDVCCVAEREGALIGAIWGRLFSGAQKGYGFVDEQTPEISIAIKPTYRGQGIGTMLLNALVATLFRQGYKQLSLSVDTRNPAWSLYKRLGFVVVSEAGTTQIMVKTQTA
jgi:ribosomal protein S18 acetylase RimI-like enzyme